MQALGRLVVALTVWLVSLIPLAPLLEIWSWPKTHEDLRYPILFDHFLEAVKSGVLYPRWLPDLFGGYGYPTFVFYPPGFFFATLPFSVLTDHPILCLGLSLAALSALGATGVYLLCRRNLGLTWSLTGTALFLATPYIYVNLYVRGDLCEFAAMMLSPWPVYFLTRLEDNARKSSALSPGSTWGAALSLAALTSSHPVSAMFYMPVFLVIATAKLSSLAPGARRGFILNVSWSVGLGLLVSSPYWLTVFQMRDYVNMEAAFVSYYQPVLHTVFPHQFFSRSWGFAGSVVNSPADGMSFQLGLVHFILASAGAFFGRRNRTILAAYLIYVVLVVMMTPLAGPVWTLPLMRSAQFPWRLLSVTAILQVICWTGLASVLPEKPARIAALAVAVLTAAFLWHLDQFDARSFDDSSRRNFDARIMAEFRARDLQSSRLTFAVMNEFAPKTSLADPPSGPRGNRPMVVPDNPGRAEPEAGHSKFHVRYRISSEQPVWVTINQLYLPGWMVVMDGQPVAREQLERELRPDGLMRVQVPAGSCLLESYYYGPPGWNLRNVIIGLGVVCYLFWLMLTIQGQSGLRANAHRFMDNSK